MEQCNERSGSWPRAFALAVLAVSPGCATIEMWRGYAWPEPVVVDTLAESRESRASGTLVVAAMEPAGGWSWRGDDAGARTWSLQPGVGADVAAALCVDPELCEVRSATIDAVRRAVGGEVSHSEAVIELDLQIRAAALGEVVAAADLAPAALRALATQRRNAFVPSGEPDVLLPERFAHCAAQLARVDLREVAGESSPVFVEAWVFVEDDGQPAFRRGAGDVPPPADERAPLAERLAALRERTLLVRVHGERGATLLRLRPDRVLLAADLLRDGARAVHRSTWVLRTPPRLLATPREDGGRVAATLHLREERWQRTIQPVLVDGEFVAKAALTPLVLALDAALGPAMGEIARRILSRGPKDTPSYAPGR